MHQQYLIGNRAFIPELHFNLSNSRQHLHVNDAAVSFRKVKEGCSFFTFDRVERSEYGDESWNQFGAVRLKVQILWAAPQRTCTCSSTSSRRAFEQVIAQHLPPRINKGWKTLPPCRLARLWEAIWLWAWQQIPCWSNRWPSASWELCPQISIIVLNSTGSCRKGEEGRLSVSLHTLV